MINIYQTVSTPSNLVRPDYILRNGKEFNIYAAKVVLEAQEHELSMLRSENSNLKSKGFSA